MRFKLKINVGKKNYGNALPISYMYEQSAVIYRILSLGDEEYTNWLHENGYNIGSKKFKLFNYSPFLIPSYRVVDDRLFVLSDQMEWYITFLPERSTETFIRGVFSDRVFQIGDKKSKVQCKVLNVEALPSPTYSSQMTFETLSPICLTRLEANGKTTYISPGDPSAKDIMLYSLTEKYRIIKGVPFSGDLSSCAFELLNTPKPKLATFKIGTPMETRVKGYHCKFKISLPKELMEIMYESGVGSKGSQGFGMVRVCNKTINRNE
ncbi:CRISPR-associated endoribonuclease Cas6 [Parabacteroides sp. 52]|uniref:CRISPR-associated endoribonuclease Cas6 n=1 Tax=unclassified Parabacteroides TaxID=2649774 RepID=UPI0013D04623|nr:MULTISPECIES: CRISPR-associated endoribonuclease Cas6 [unclassified Parabacteroides]MDH6535003.1 CRISPR-associated endoribonuclease Cas6 [Parabacteroides sp. PM5-20]NDV55263.1 CRISPR-associated endoribonuclease Cas6 [Parabacteroides sp. 52]